MDWTDSSPSFSHTPTHSGVRDEKALALAGKLLAVDPKERPGADDAADDDFFWSPDEATGEFQDPEHTDPAKCVFGGLMWMMARPRAKQCIYTFHMVSIDRSPSHARGSLPRLVPFKPGVSLDDLHEYSLKRR